MMMEGNAHRMVSAFIRALSTPLCPHLMCPRMMCLPVTFLSLSLSLSLSAVVVARFTGPV